MNWYDIYFFYLTGSSFAFGCFLPTKSSQKLPCFGPVAVDALQSLLSVQLFVQFLFTSASLVMASDGLSWRMLTNKKQNGACKPKKQGIIYILGLVYIYICMYIYIYVYVCVYIYIYPMFFLVNMHHVALFNHNIPLLKIDPNVSCWWKNLTKHPLILMVKSIQNAHIWYKQTCSQGHIPMFDRLIPNINSPTLSKYI